MCVASQFKELIAVRTDIHSVELEWGCLLSQKRRGLYLKGDRDSISKLKIGYELRLPQCSGYFLHDHSFTTHSFILGGTVMYPGYIQIRRVWNAIL